MVINIMNIIDSISVTLFMCLCFCVQLNWCSMRSSSVGYESENLLTNRTFNVLEEPSQSSLVDIPAPSPQVSYQNCYASEDGLAIIITFETAVHITHDWKSESSTNSLQVCEQFLSNKTVDYLSFYGLKSCFWSTKIQLIISVEKPISENTIIVKFKRHVLKASTQLTALYNEAELDVVVRKLSSEPSWSNYEPLLAVTGPSEVPNCGFFALIGHFSSPRGTTDVHFEWYIAGDVSSELKEHVETHGKTTNLILHADLFQYHTPYNFLFRAVVPGERTLEVGHTLIRLRYDSPLVSIYHTRLLQSTPLYSDQDIILFAEVSVPECVFPIQKVILSWKVSNDSQIGFPLNDSLKMHSISLEIKPNSFPIDRAVDIYLYAFLGHRFNHTSGARFTFVSSKAPLKAGIANSTTKIAIGSNSGSLRLSSKSSKSSPDLIYQWSCHDSQTAQPCLYNFGASNQIIRNDTLLIDSKLQMKSELELNSSSLEPNRYYLFGLQVFDKNDTKISSETEYMSVKVIEGCAPQLFLGPVFIKGKHPVSFNPLLSAYLVPEHTSITIKAIIRPNKLIENIRWEAPNGLYKLNWNSEQRGEETHTELYISDSQIYAFGVYVFKWITCNRDNECSEADITLMATQSVSMCELLVENFTEYDLSFAKIDKCNTPPNAAPLTYQLFLADESLTNPMPLSVPQFSSFINFRGTPIIDRNRIVRFAAQVCDRFGSCHLYYSGSVTVEKTNNESSAINEILKIARRHHKSGDSIAALSTLGTVLIKQRALPETNLTDKVINNSTEYSRHALELTDQILTDGHLAVVYSTLSNGLLLTEDILTKRKLLAIIQKYTQKAVSLKTLPKLETIKSLYSNLMKSFQRNEYQKSQNLTLDKDLLQDIRSTFRELKYVCASQIPLGTTLRLRSYSVKSGHEVDNAITEITHTHRVHDYKMMAKMGSNQTVEAKIDFGDEIKTNYSNSWNCDQPMPCRSVVFSVTLFPNDSPYPQKEESHRLASVIDLSVHAPNTGKEQVVRGHRKAAKFHLTITGNASLGGSDMITLCHYYDEHYKTWKVDAVWPLGIVYNKAGCWAGHLSTFTILRTVAGISADYVIGVFVACLMGVLVFGIMLVFFVQKKREDSNRIAPTPVESPPKKPLENPRYRQTKQNGIEIQAVSQYIE